VEKKQRRPRRKFTAEFKCEAVELSRKIGIAKASEELNVDGATLRNWRLKEESQGSAVGKRSYADLEKDVRRLTKEIGYLEEINKVLKKSTAIFSKDHMGGLK
jgi:transposase